MSAVIKLLLGILETLLPQISPELRELFLKGMDSMIDRLEVLAERTPNKFDDLLVKMLRDVLQIPDYPDTEPYIGDDDPA